MIDSNLSRTANFKRNWRCLIVACVGFGFATIASVGLDAQVTYGVNNPRLLASPDAVWKPSLDSMAANGVHMVRTAISSKDKSADHVIAFLRYAEQLSIKVVLIFPDQNPIYYGPEAVAPQGSDNSGKKGLAAIELPRFSAYWQAHRTALRQAGVHVYAYELGNELNGASFNSDYPKGAGAALLNLASCDNQPGCTGVRAGWDNYIGMLKIMRGSGLLDGALVLGGSFVRVGEGYVRQAQISFSTVQSTRAYLAAHGADKFVDAYTFHIYPVVPPNADPATGQSEIARQINAAYSECRSVATKPCWVTEWGFPDQAAKCEQSPKQDAYLEDADAVFRQEASQQGGMVADYYAWDTGDKFAVYGCGRVASPVIARLLKSR